MRRLYQILLITGCLAIGSYLFIRFHLQGEIKRSASKYPVVANDTGAIKSRQASLVDLRPLFIAKIKQVVKDGSKGLYDLSIDSMSIDVLHSSAVLHQVRITPNDRILNALKEKGEDPEDVFHASFQSLQVEGINLDDVVGHKTIDFRLLHVSKPRVEVFHHKTVSEKKDTTTLYKRLMKHMKSIGVEKLVIDEGKLVYHNPQKKNKLTRINNFDLRLNDIKIDAATQDATNRFLFAKSGVLSIHDYVTYTTNNRYMLRIKKLTVAAPEKLMTLQDLSLSSRYKRKQWHNSLQEEEYDLRLPHISVHNVNWWALMNGDSFIADNLVINGGKLKVFLDRSLPPPRSKMGRFPIQLLAKLPMQVFLKKMQLKNLDLTYQEYNPRSKMSGVVRFGAVSMTSSTITNVKSQMALLKTTTLTATARLMDKIPFKASFVFDLNHPQKAGFSSALTTGAFDGDEVNKVAVPLGLLKIEKGQVKHTNMYIKGNENAASGKVALLYNDLKISIYEKEAGEKGLDKKGMMGLLANMFVIKNDNPKNGEGVRTPGAGFQRDPQAGFFNLVWKTGLVGVLKTIGVNPKLAEKK